MLHCCDITALRPFPSNMKQQQQVLNSTFCFSFTDSTHPPQLESQKANKTAMKFQVVIGQCCVGFQLAAGPQGGSGKSALLGMKAPHF